MLPEPLRLLRAVCDPVRWQVLEFLRAPRMSSCSQAGGVCACDFEGVLELCQSTVSHHMRVLVEAGLVRSEKRGRWVFYELVPEVFQALIDALAPFARHALAAGSGLAVDGDCEVAAALDAVGVAHLGGD